MKQDRMLYGDPSGRHPQALAALVEPLARGGIPAQAVPDIRMEVWLKLWGKSNMNPLSELSRADILPVLDDPGVAGLVEGIMREMATIAVIGLPIGRGIPERLVTTRRLGAYRTSVLQEREAGRAMKLGPMFGCLVELAQRLEVSAPLLTGIHGLVRLLDRNRDR